MPTMWSDSPGLEMHGLLFLHPGEACQAGFPSLVSHPGTNRARPCLASEVKRDRACSGRDSS